MNYLITQPGSPELQLNLLKIIIGDTEGKTMCDLCCGESPNTRKLGFKKRTFVDVVTRDQYEENENFIQSDVFTYLEFQSNNEDVMILLDAIEHFVHKDALQLLYWMERMSQMQIIFTPLGDYLIETIPTNNPDSHKSGWLPKDFNKLGYATIEIPNFHPLLGIGAFFAFKTKNTELYFEAIKEKLQWIK